ncbi:unnamed protein product [Phytophthora lilii]|uniref:Unnamed protein product n=1 Tax=Phytophthora lilii TaxID=2077276 RepID=A0A9W6TJ23_9STRA|nr:unnamed protein product [Phytophthora lilii]
MQPTTAPLQANFTIPFLGEIMLNAYYAVIKEDGIDVCCCLDVLTGARAYFTGLSSTKGGSNRCAGSISPTHVLTTSGCMSRDIRWAFVGARHYNKTEDGEAIKVVAIFSHPKAVGDSNDFMVLKLESPSSIKPVALTMANCTDTTVGEWADAIGWKFIAELNDSVPER